MKNKKQRKITITTVVDKHKRQTSIFDKGGTKKKKKRRRVELKKVKDHGNALEQVAHSVLYK